MRWKRKAFTFHVLERLPFGERAYYWIQKNVTKSLVMTDEKYFDAFRRKVIRPLVAIKKYGQIPLNSARFFEFGAGWDLLCPLGFSILGGVNDSICVDLNEFMHKVDIYHCIDFYGRNIDELKNRLNDKELLETCKNGHEPIINKNTDILDFLKNSYGIEYKAPCDAGHTELSDGSVDYIVVNTTLQHIPWEDVNRITKECFRILKSGGLFITNVNYLDHYANFDRKINHYNFLQYSEKDWARYSPSLHYQNRRRHSDYQRCFLDAGFEILQEDLYERKPDDLDKLRSIKLAKEFERYDEDDLVILGSSFVLCKP